MYQSHHLKNKLKILDSLSLYEESDAAVFRRKLEVLKEIALALVEELESLESVRSVNLRRGINLPDEMRRFEVHLIQSALERTGGHQTRAAPLVVAGAKNLQLEARGRPGADEEVQCLAR